MRPQRVNGRTPGRSASRNRTGNGRDKQNGDANSDFDPVEVYARIRPLDVPESEKCIKMLDDTKLQVVSSDMHYTFSKVFGETTSQKYLFDCVGAPLVDDLIHGKNGLLFTYGITSSGKTYTMTGTGDDQGILPRCLDMVFNSIEHVQARRYMFIPDKQNGFDVQTEADAMLERQKELMSSSKFKVTKDPVNDYSQRQKDPSKVIDIDEDSNYAIFVSFIEIYNNYIYDLLEELPYDPITGNKPPQSKILREDLQRVMFVHNVSEVEVKSTEEAFEILAKGQRRRKVAHTVLNAESSRSHSVFNIRLVQAPLDHTGKDILTDKNKVTVSQLSLVDLAGSERTNRTKNSGDRLKEAGQINQSLMVLRQCIDILRENQKQGANKMVPYRDSKVTHLFKNYFDGEGKVRMIVCVNPRAAEYDETLHVMRFSEAAQEVQVHKAVEKPKFSEEGFVRGRRRLATEGVDLAPPPPPKKPSLETMPHNPVSMNEIYSFTPFPPIIPNAMDTSDNDLLQLLDYLQRLDKEKQKHHETVFRKQESFRQLLQTVEKENMRLHKEANRLSDALRDRDKVIDDQNGEKDRLERRLKSIEKENNILRQKMSLYEHEKKELEDELQNKHWELHKTDYQIERQRAEYERKVEEVGVEYSKQLEAERLRIQQEAKENLTVKERKLQLLRNIVNSTDVESLAGDVAQDRTPIPTPNHQQTRGRPANHAPQTASYATPTVSSMKKEARSAAAPRTRPPVTRSRARSPPATVGRPTAARNHRRSRSTGERWLDHRPEAILPIDTILQPKIKKKKSVSKLEVKDTNKASKYLLTTQEQDNVGQIETKLIKGDVRASAGGGSSVVFTEVETLKQSSPGDKRRQYIPTSRDDYDGEWTDTEERCNIAIEGHGVYKRIQQFDKHSGALV